MMEIRNLHLSNGKSPFLEWIRRLSRPARVAINEYINRVAAGGGRKNVKSLGDGLFEIKIDKGPGYRVYFGQRKKMIIILIAGGDKASQTRDIALAKKYWREYDV